MSSEVNANYGSRLRDENERPTPMEAFSESVHPCVRVERLWTGGNFVACADAAVDVVSALTMVMVSNPTSSSASRCPAVRRSTASCSQNARTSRTRTEGALVVEAFVASGMAGAAGFIAGDA